MFCWSKLTLELSVATHVKVTVVPAYSRYLSREISTTGGSTTEQIISVIYNQSLPVRGGMMILSLTEPLRLAVHVYTPTSDGPIFLSDRTDTSRPFTRL